MGPRGDRISLPDQKFPVETDNRKVPQRKANKSYEVGQQKLGRRDRASCARFGRPGGLILTRFVLPQLNEAAYWQGNCGRMAKRVHTGPKADSASRPKRESVSRRGGLDGLGQDRRQQRRPDDVLGNGQSPTVGQQIVVMTVRWEYLNGNGALWFVEEEEHGLDNFLQGSIHILNSLGQTTCSSRCPATLERLRYPRRRKYLWR